MGRSTLAHTLTHHLKSHTLNRAASEKMLKHHIGLGLAAVRADVHRLGLVSIRVDISRSVLLTLPERALPKPKDCLKEGLLMMIKVHGACRKKRLQQKLLMPRLSLD